MSIASFLIYCVIVTFTPGPSNIYIISLVHNQGRNSAKLFTYGATIAFGILLSISAALSGVLSGYLPKFLPIMQISGSLYILYLAVQVFRSNSKKITDKNQKSSPLVTGFIMQFINPKVVLFTMTVIPTFVLPYYQTPAMLALFVGILTVIGFLAYSTWAVFGSIFKALLQKYQKPVNIVLALFLVYSAFMASGLLELIPR